MCLAYEYKGDGSEKPTREECESLCRDTRVFVHDSQLRDLSLREGDPFGTRAVTTTRAYSLTTQAGAGAGANTSAPSALSERQAALLLRKLAPEPYERAREKDAGNPNIYEACDIVVDTPRSCSSQFYYVKHFNNDPSDSEPYFSVTAKHPWRMH